MTDSTLTQERLIELLDYNQETGVFTWKHKRQGIRVNRIAGGKSHGYVQIAVDGTAHKAHRLAWLYVHGEYPEHQIDHINHRRSDNRFKNIRAVTHAENQHNRAANKNNTSGVAGVYSDKRTGRWMASIRVNNKTIYLGMFGCVTSAAIERKKAESKYGFHVNHCSGATI